MWLNLLFFIKIKDRPSSVLDVKNSVNSFYLKKVYCSKCIEDNLFSETIKRIINSLVAEYFV